jgi:hypothetical protein
MQPRRFLVLSVSASILLGLTSYLAEPVLSLPPPEDTPEEVLRMEIITQARSPVDGKPLTAGEYAELQAQLQTRASAPQLTPKVRELIFLLRVRQGLLKLFPFLDI